MTAEHGDETNRPPAGGDPAAPARFEVVLRGYDRRQVEEHIATLERTIARQRSELETARSEQLRLEKASSAASAGNAAPQAARQPQPAAMYTPPAGAPPAGAHRDAGALNPEMITSFTTRLQSILQAAEEEAEQVRTNARSWAQAEEQAGRARMEELERRRQSVLSELGRVRNQLDGLLSQAENHGERTSSTAPATVVARKAAPGSPSSEPVAAESARVNTAPRSAPSAGRAGPQVLPSHARPASTPGAPGAPARSGASTPARPGQPAPPTPQPGAQPAKPTPQPKPRPTPSPRPRSSSAGGNLPGAEMSPGKPDAGSRNGTTAGGDDDGRSAFGSGAR